MKLGILYAMDKEAGGLLHKLSARAMEPVAGMGLYTLPQGHILCVGGVGKVNAAMAAQALIDCFGVDAVLNAGCAGALTELPAGTILTANHCVQHDVDTSLCGDPVGFVSTVNVVKFPCAPVPLAGTVSGVVATGDWFGRDLCRARDVRDRFGADLCDMEAGAVAQVCLRHGLPCFVLKSVSDHLFADDQGREYEENFAKAMDALDAAVAAAVKELT